jgi:hypothetical protein
MRRGRQALRRARIGAIFIEFAVVIPVLVAVLYYLHDVPKYKRMYSRMGFCAHEMASILQNVSQNRQSKRITRRDFAYAAYASSLSYYGGGTKQYFYGTSSIPFVHPVLYCVKGLTNGKARIVWGIRQMWFMPPDKYIEPAVDAKNYSVLSLIKVDIQTDFPATSIFPTLKIKDGEIKMILEVFFHCHLGRAGASDYFKFLLLLPRLEGDRAFFNTAIIFTPKQELFNEAVPQSL